MTALHFTPSRSMTGSLCSIKHGVSTRRVRTFSAVTRGSRKPPCCPHLPRITWMAAGLILSVSGPVACGDECTNDDDCLRSEATLEAGRCAPKDIYCSKGMCRAQCLEPCTSVDTRENPCGSGLLCTGSGDGSGGYCSAKPVECRSVSDCPTFVPPGGSGAGWQCSAEVCRHPDWEYAIERSSR